jgi:aspartate/methionine/tyrosine aminotransferase
MSIRYSRRSSHDTAPNALALARDAVSASGRPWLDLTVSNPTRADIPYDQTAILDALRDERALVYEPAPFGLRSAREAVSRELGSAVPSSRVVLTASTSEAYAFLFKLLCDPGDDVLVPQPSYPLFELLARFEGVELVPYRLAYDGQWHVDTDSLRRARGPRTRAVLAVSPNNPTGSYLKKDELAAIADLDLPIVSDEVFASYSFADDARRATTALDATGSLVFALGGLSKLAALPQMKLAWIAAGGPGPVVASALERLELIADSFLSVGTPVQHAASTLLATRGPAERAIQERTRTNLATLRESVGARSAATVLDVEGGWYATLRLPGVLTEERWVLDLLEKDGVYTHPGHFFDLEDGAHLVVSLLTPREVFAEGVQRILGRVAAET